MDRIALTRAIRDLPAGYRKIFLLHEVEGYEHQEIARLLDCSVGIRSATHKAKLRIRISEPACYRFVSKCSPMVENIPTRRIPPPTMGFGETASALG